MERTAVVVIDDANQMVCRVPEGLSVHMGDQCVVSVDRLLEIGRVERLDPNPPPASGGFVPVVKRCATLQDLARADENQLMTKMAMDACVKCVEELGLDMRLINVRYSFDRHRLTVQFSAEQRVDFREMIKRLASQLNTRVEMRQLGVRDEAGIIGGLGPCGRRLCCCSWLKHFESINVKMAKAQRLTLTPGAINGMCGRLKCCLRYEYEAYKDLGRRLPREGAVIECAEGRGQVISKNILAQRVRVRLEDERTIECHIDDIGRVLRDRERGCAHHHRRSSGGRRDEHSSEGRQR